jgi:hypothetical protein
LIAAMITLADPSMRGGQRRGVVSTGGRIVGVQLDQSRHLHVRVSHQRHERKHLTANSRHGQQVVMMPGQVSSFVGEDRAR